MLKNPAKFDIVYLADLRFPGGTSSALVVEIKAALEANLAIGVLAFKGPLLTYPHLIHPEIRKILEGGKITRLDPEQPISTKTVIAHHPGLFINIPTINIQLETQNFVLVLHHPTHNRAGKEYYDIDQVVRNCHGVFGRLVQLAPVSSVVRNTLPIQPPNNSAIMKEDWANLLVMKEWPARKRRAPRYPVYIGRHSRSDASKWPNKKKDILAAYPADGEKYRIKILGSTEYIKQKFGNRIPTNWELEDYKTHGISSFLQSLDFFVYFHSDEWIEAFGRTILEALATGLVVILPKQFEPIFGDAAVYCAISEITETLGKFVSNANSYQRQSTKARKYAENNADSKHYMGRLITNGLVPPKRQKKQLLNTLSNTKLPKKTILLFSSNGIGVGHLAQQLAIARCLPIELRPVFVTMCLSIEFPIEQGYLTHFIPYHSQLSAISNDWNIVLAEELFELIVSLQPVVFAYDATSVFDGVSDALSRFPNLFKIWVRRPMWREIHRPLLTKSTNFDAVVEPDELASQFDHGPTANERDQVLLVPPVIQLNPEERFSPDVAREALELPNELRIVAIQLGAGTNFDMVLVRNRIVESLLKYEDVLVLDIQSSLSEEHPTPYYGHARYRKIFLTPMYRYSKAFNACVCAAGYNTFHEQIFGSIPTLFIPNEAEHMDLQLNRARWATLTGRGLLARVDFDLHRIPELIDRLLDPDEQNRMISLCQKLNFENGAQQIANFIDENSRIVRTDWDITRAVD